MLSASQLLHAYVGAPAVDGAAAVEGSPPCWICAHPVVRGLDREKWASGSMTDQNQCRAPSSRWICEACFFVRAGTPGSVPAGTHSMTSVLRVHSHLYDESATPRCQHVTKGDKPAILRFLRAPHAGTWFAAIADSGKKHVVSYTPVNPPGSRGRAQFEEQTIALPDAAGWRITDDLRALLTAGATKAEVECGDYTPRAWTLCRERVEAFERAWGHLRGGGWFSLALWLSQRDEAAVAERMTAEAETRKAKAGKATRAKAAKPKAEKATTKRGRVPRAKEATSGETDRGAEREPAISNRGVPSGDASSVPGNAGVLGAQALRANPEPSHERGTAERDGGRVGDCDAPRPASAAPCQLGLPGFA